MPQHVAGEEVSSPSKVLLIEGWRGISHSIALANQHQILELLKLHGLKLYHHDLPFAFSHWTQTPGGSGFDAIDYAAVEKVPPLPDDVAVDCVYRICAPIRAGDTTDQRRTVTFMTTEMGLGSGSFADGGQRSDFFTRCDNTIVTPSEWSRQRLLDHGYAAKKVNVVPHGVDTTVFTPLTEVERTLNRVQMGFHSDETVFVNVGVALWNKGIDVLLRAFAALRTRGRRVRLVLKDQRDVYGISVEETLRSTGATCPELLRPETLAAISVIPGKLERAQLRTLYGIADAYVSPYRAEGFNLPVLEAIACGTALIVTQGGATDDFCSDDVAWRIPGRQSVHIDPATGAKGRYIEPDLDALVAAMDGLVGGRVISKHFAAARENVLARFTWAKAAEQLATLTVGLETRHAATSGVTPLGRPVRVDQRHIPVEQATLRRAFQTIYKEGLWGHGSGPGSSPANTIEYRAFVERFIEANSIRTVTDLGCGDWQFSHLINWSHVEYVGFDVVPEIVTSNRSRFAAPNRRFEEMTAIDDLPGGDLLLSKEVLQHLPNQTIIEYLALIRRKYRFALLTNAAEPIAGANTDIVAGGWRPVRLQDAPFNTQGAVIFSYVPNVKNDVLLMFGTAS